ncbi:MAG TPA: isopenicillin N synthase family oxygenase [Aeromonadales bacterium]|nr:isopenicillin N synthase family oxygenase [Aeromonadales bacterium]
MNVIDLKLAQAPELFVQSLHETGFGILDNHPINQKLVESIYHDWLQFFNSHEKQLYLYNKDTQDGFFPASISEKAKGFQEKDLKEFYHVFPWGQIPPSLKDKVLEYYDSTAEFAARLLNWIEEFSPDAISSRYSEPLSSMIKDTPKTVLRILHYPPLSGNEKPGAVRAAAHEDINLITLLPAANNPGLQLKLKNGQWIDVPCNFGNLIINIGDMLQEVSEGYFPSTSHRVINPQQKRQNQSRISLPLFVHPRDEVVLSERYTSGQYLDERLKELGVK